MSQALETLRRLRAAYAEFRTAVAAQRTACLNGDAEAVLAAAVEGDWLSARIAELHAERALTAVTADPATLVERAACAAEAEALAKELEALAASVAGRRDALAHEIAAMPASGPGAYQTPAPMLLDARG